MAANRLGLRFMIDTNLIADSTPAMQELWGFHREGWIELARSDVVETELQEAPAEKKGELLKGARRTSEYFGPAVFGHSRWGSAVWGNEQDHELLRAAFQAIYPNREYGKNPNDLRDAMQVAWAIRYAMDGLITRDKALLRSDRVVRQAFNGFGIGSPEDALSVVRRLKGRHDYRHQNPPSGWTE